MRVKTFQRSTERNSKCTSVCWPKHFHVEIGGQQSFLTHAIQRDHKRTSAYYHRTSARSSYLRVLSRFLVLQICLALLKLRTIQYDLIKLFKISTKIKEIMRLWLSVTSAAYTKCSILARNMRYYFARKYSL